MKTAILPRSNIASNVGNDFFYKGVEYALKICGYDVFGTYFNPYNAYKLNAKQIENNLDYQSWDSTVNAIVISGPVLDKDFALHFEKMLTMAKNTGKKIFLLSVGGRKYDTEEISHCSEVLSKYQPDVFISRDSDTYSNYNTLAKSSYDGICFAFFAPLYFKGYQTTKKYYSSCFDFAPEPDLEMVINSFKNGKINDLGKSHGTKSTFNKVKHVLQRNFVSSIDDIEIVRLNHRPIRNSKFVFNRKNVISSFLSESYLNIYKNTSLTVTDRLHAAVATLAFGKPAMLCLDSNRTKLLERAGVSGCVNNIYHADLEALEEERDNQLSFLKNSV